METPRPLEKCVADCQSPHTLLQPYIDQYFYYKMQVPDGLDVQRFLPFRAVGSFNFFLGSDFEIIDPVSNRPTPFTRFIIRPPGKKMLYLIRLHGLFISFSIIFKPAGLYRLFGTPLDLPARQSTKENAIRGFPVAQVTNKLMDAPDISTCVQIMESYLLFFAQRSSPVPQSVEEAVLKLEQHHNAYSIEKLASESYLSLRHFERIFNRYIGLTPKKFFRLNRIVKLLDAKKNAPHSKWGSLAHEFGFYDQMHLVKEFKYFLHQTPTSFDLSEMSL